MRGREIISISTRCGKFLTGCTVALLLVVCTAAFAGGETMPIHSEMMLYALHPDEGEGRLVSPERRDDQDSKVIADYMKELAQVNAATAQMVSQIGAYQYQRLDDLHDKAFLMKLNENLEKYRETRKYYVEKCDGIVKSYVDKLGMTGATEEEFIRTETGKLVKLEMDYLDDLSRYYRFMIDNHDKIEFLENSPLLKTDELKDEYNVLVKELGDSINRYRSYLDPASVNAFDQEKK